LRPGQRVALIRLFGPECLGVVREGERGGLVKWGRPGESVGLPPAVVGF
jgi:hypothetical protein